MPVHDPPQVAIIESRTAQHNTVHAFLLQRLQHSQLTFRFLVRVTQEHIVALCVGHVFRTSGHVGEKWISNV
jgi:hypothetical protein